MRKIAFTNQKGGVGKTTTTVNTGAGLANLGYRVLLVDMDPQANLTYSVKLNSNRIDKNVYHLLKGDVAVTDIIMKHKQFDILPSSIELSGAEMELVNIPAREMLLKDALQEVSGKYDFVLIDCPPNLGVLTLNAFTAADELVIVLQSEYLALHGLSKLMDVIQVVQRRLNKNLKVEGILCTLYDNRKNLNREVVGHIRDYFGAKVFNTVIRDNVALAEAPSHHKTIFEYDGESNGAIDYQMFAKEIRNGH
ncbi:ParA family protein [Rhodohalobacter mucosus]|uniref:Chromosome partitioning protein ParA n=1 Tax=Rhodohalobacter mucosus TaxID=2079485 RepID=A0A316TUE3_9BACT|nr:AAA family ATPase [Rhodohalobacter mucosus]PWN07448.1 chromosome partitioning protein ParA [Rhodohalobacter mucosus]